MRCAQQTEDSGLLLHLFPTLSLLDIDVLQSGRTISRSQAVDGYLSAEKGEVNSYDLSH